MTFKEYHQKSPKEHALAENICNCEIIYGCGAIDFHGELIAIPLQSERGLERACSREFL
ncbi:hypothetical protein [Janthinobacterium sp. AD80]|uniref:hypothetical protein n=1 Tax=unclassified Janthinobacterium TaxID=2610881 RepID=UPI0015E09059|nr:hypothetical protein [Janthinobacterium sp. AD80]